MNESKKKYKKKSKRICIEFWPTEMDLWEYLNSHSPKQRFIKDLIRENQKKNSPG